ncbi:DMT family protein, partial [Salmonella enterica]
MSPVVPPYLQPILLLVASNVFMTFAWYGHLKHKNSALWLVIV